LEFIEKQKQQADIIKEKQNKQAIINQEKADKIENFK
jgi:hypothetical protein